MDGDNGSGRGPWRASTPLRVARPQARVQRVAGVMRNVWPGDPPRDPRAGSVANLHLLGFGVPRRRVRDDPSNRAALQDQAFGRPRHPFPPFFTAHEPPHMGELPKHTLHGRHSSTKPASTARKPSDNGVQGERPAPATDVDIDPERDVNELEKRSPRRSF
jgi:hypothetical protein